jgi:hypothetical protein
MRLWLDMRKSDRNVRYYVVGVIPRIIFNYSNPIHGDQKEFVKTYFAYIEKCGDDKTRNEVMILKDKFCEKYNLDENFEHLYS